MNTTIRIGTRGSKLALWQAHYTQQQLKTAGIDSELAIIKTQGDRIQHLSFDKMEGKGFFTKEIEDALLREDIDLAVHSMKDLPTRSPEGLSVAAVSYRENPADWLVVRRETLEAGALFQLPQGAVVGTSSARRKAQLLDFRPDIEIRDIRGNVPTRLRKLSEGQFDAIMLAAAGLSRLELDTSAFHIVKFSPKEFIPAPAQGVLAWQTRAGDTATRRALKHIHQAEVSAITNIERRVLNLLDGGCQMPLGVYCEQDEQGNYHVWAAKADAWNAPVKKVRLSQSTNHQLAERVVEALKD
ncbi:MAG: hydroxymethylbilane synthase [Lewinellaceae bacterium]|nr:hydroxymethylbilane synthase [Phaeodactylibacter sp.]MCB9036509.1 hydroxymethylbilane synthase [Lewinellaceae bacterium]